MSLFSGNTGKWQKCFIYDSYADDFVSTTDETVQIPEDYIWVNNSKVYRVCSYLLYQCARVFSIIYCHMILRVKLENHVTTLHKSRSGCFLYGNHTQPVGDVFSPVRVLKFLAGKRLHIIASPANLGIRIIGKLIPAIGAIPVPTGFNGMRGFKSAIETRINQGRCIAVYPEAHVWPYYTEIRPFEKGSFRFPVELDVPAFCMTTTYQKAAHRRKPKITIHVDGPFYPEEGLTKRQQQEQLAEAVRLKMIERSRSSNCQYIEYVRRNEE